jgi:hypothetical protein
MIKKKEDSEDMKDTAAYEDAKNLMESIFEEKRKGGRLSKAHAEDHAIAVANGSSATAYALTMGQGYPELVRDASLYSALAGLLHDIEREAHEETPHGPKGAELFGRFWSQMHNLRLRLDEYGYRCIARAIENHEKSFEEISGIFGDPLGMGKEDVMPSVVAHSLKTGDAALETSGYRVIERRSSFVGRERMQPGGDLGKILKYPEQSHLAVLGEGLIRLYQRNTIAGYPDWLRPFEEEWYAIQYLFTKGLLRYEGMGEEDAAHYFNKMGFTKFNQEIVDRIAAERHFDGGYFSYEEYPVLSGKISEMNGLGEGELDDLAESSYRVVRLISGEESSEDAIRKYSRDGIGELDYAKEFMDGIIAYRSGSGEFLDDFARKIEKSVRMIKGKKE